MERNVDWSELNLDLVYLISKKIPDLSDFVRFRAVCKWWRSAVPASDPSPRFPWIYQHRNSLLEDFDFYSLPYAKTITFESSDKKVGNAVYGGYPVKYYLNLLSFRKDWQTMGTAPLNPPSRSLIPVPPPRSWYRLHMMKQEMNSVVKCGEYNFLFENIVFEGKYNLGLCSGDWIFKEDHYRGTGNAYHKGMYFEDSPTEGTTIIDVHSGKVLLKIPPHERVNLDPVAFSLKADQLSASLDPVEEFEDEKFSGDESSNKEFSDDDIVELPNGMHCLIESSSGELLKVYRPYDIYMDVEETYFEVYRLCMDAEQAFWIEIKNIGDEMLFLDYSATGLALNACDFAGCEGNCIYFLKGEILEAEKFPSFILCRYNMVDGKIQKLPYPSERWGTWVIPFLG
ncbi:hypothetical protein LUZ63_000800 [Rhynchospora breviuscula]|uniref:KIB1-4 beta-propeller domain-containing protein n=1 Tax=Rhynchospora breviuscula TaxID=2022672 RepID=A0A9Q0HWG6_9POAL|nr:hypothetical protein LUZ63_000800 [Rhynchospora breviuscula]